MHALFQPPAPEEEEEEQKQQQHLQRQRQQRATLLRGVAPPSCGVAQPPPPKRPRPRLLAPDVSERLAEWRALCDGWRQLLREAADADAQLHERVAAELTRQVRGRAEDEQATLRFLRTYIESSPFGAASEVS